MTNKTTPRAGLTDDDLHECLLYAGPQQRAAFLAKFGRDPSEDDPWFFDPSADEPRPYSREAVRLGTAPICHWLADLARCASDEFEAAAFEAMLHASKKTGLVLDQYSYLCISQEDRDAYDGALREYLDSSPAGTGVSLGTLD